MSVKHIISALVAAGAITSQVPGMSAVKRVSTAGDGSQGSVVGCSHVGGGTQCEARSKVQSISADGRFIAFTSISDNLVPNDTNLTADIFVKDRLTGAILRASTNSSGIQANDAFGPGSFTGSHAASISADGRFVAFESYASNLVPGDTNDDLDVFVKDLQTGAITRALFNGGQGDHAQYAPALSANGRYVAFISTSTNLYPQDPATFRVYRYDLQTGNISVVAAPNGPGTLNINTSASLSISSDGRYVAFGGKETGFTWWRVIRRDLVANTLAVASVTNDGNSANGHSASGNTLAEDQNIDMSPDGRFVVFTSDATNLDPGDMDTNRDVYLRDFQTSTTSLVSRGTNNQTLGGVCYNVSVSGDGRFAAFDSTIVGLDLRDIRIFVRDRQFNTLRNAPYAPASTAGVFHPAIADNGRFMSFHSTRGDLVPNDTNSGSGLPDVFAVDLLAAPSHRNDADFDGEALSDLSVFRPSDGNWYWLTSGSGQFSVAHWGANGDVPVAADVDGDARTDLAVFRPSNGVWYIVNSSTGTVSIQQFGQNGDKPVAADYDGDEKADIAVFRPGDGVWYIAQSGGGFRFQQWGQSTDRPVVGDFNGDGRSDLTVFRPATGVWYMLESPLGVFRAIPFGVSSDRPVAADYNGDGITDLAVFRPSSGVWYFDLSHRMLPQINPPLQYDFAALQWGTTQDLPAPADVDGDGRADPSVFRTTTGVWYVSQSNLGTRIQQFGTTGDVPIAFASESN